MPSCVTGRGELGSSPLVQGEWVRTDLRAVVSYPTSDPVTQRSVDPGIQSLSDPVTLLIQCFHPVTPPHWSSDTRSSAPSIHPSSDVLIQ